MLFQLKSTAVLFTCVPIKAKREESAGCCLWLLLSWITCCCCNTQLHKHWHWSVVPEPSNHFMCILFPLWMTKLFRSFNLLLATFQNDIQFNLGYNTRAGAHPLRLRLMIYRNVIVLVMSICMIWILQRTAWITINYERLYFMLRMSVICMVYLMDCFWCTQFRW